MYVPYHTEINMARGQMGLNVLYPAGPRQGRGGQMGLSVLYPTGP